MKILRFILISVVNVLFSSADPNMFGSKKRRKEKQALARQAEANAAETQSLIDEAQTQNPFETAAAKSAMAKAGRNATQIQNRYANMMGGKGSAESMIAMQGKTQDAVAGAAGDIATGAEAMKKAEVGQLRGIKTGQTNQAYALAQSASNERGSAWRDFFTGAMPLGKAFQGGSKAASQ